MRSFTTVIALGALLVSTSAQAGTPVRSGGNLGLGLGGGYWFNGLSGKYYMSDRMAVQGVLGAYGIGLPGYGGLGLTADYLWEMPAIMQGSVLEVAWSAGLGPSVGVGDQWVALGAHGTLGLELNFQKVPIDVALEYKPGLEVLPALGPDFLSFGGHVRVYPF